jgi:hypothetical protein
MEVRRNRLQEWEKRARKVLPGVVAHHFDRQTRRGFRRFFDLVAMPWTPSSF